MAAPPTTVLDTAVVVSVETVACRIVIPGVVATMTNWYVARFQTAATTSTASSVQVMSRTDVQTSATLVNCGRNHTKTATTSATDGATEIPSDRDGMRRLERVTQVSPQYIGRRFYVFPGGCITVVFRLNGPDRSEPLALATQTIGAVPREQLRDLVREQSDGRLELDPPEAQS